MSNGENEEVRKRDEPPGVGSDRRKVQKKFIDKNQQGDTVSKGVGAACGVIIGSTWYRPETRLQMQKLMESRSELGPHCRRGARNRGLMMVSITVS